MKNKEKTRIEFYKYFAKRIFVERGTLKLIISNKNLDQSKREIYEDYRRNIIKSV